MGSNVEWNGQFGNAEMYLDAFKIFIPCRCPESLVLPFTSGDRYERGIP